jgi:molybdate transport system substrate-binding protein
MIWTATLTLLSIKVGPTPIQDQELNVFAAASLRDCLEPLAKRFEASHPGVNVQLQFAGSQQLAAQINQGAPCDLFASAAQKNLDQVAYDPSTRRIFALNRLVIVVPSAAEKVHRFSELSRVPSLVLAAPAVPAGAYARQALQSAGQKFGSRWLGQVNAHVVSEEQDVRSVLAKVELGEADAGIVYASDAVSGRGKVRAISIPDEYQPRIAYPIAIMKGSKIAHDATAFIHELLSADGQQTFRAQGFLSPLDDAHILHLTLGGRDRILRLPFPSRLPRITIQTPGPGGLVKSYTGTPLTYFVGKSKVNRVRFTGADEYGATIPWATLKSSQAMIVMTPGNFAQVVVPGQKPNVWIGWLTHIVGE